jgi:hypothetical protein
MSSQTIGPLLDAGRAAVSVIATGNLLLSFGSDHTSNAQADQQYFLLSSRSAAILRAIGYRNQIPRR